METVYVSIPAKKFINRGFLAGFFCPIYGVGAILIIQSSKWVDIIFKDYFMSLIISMLFSIILVTVLEYITGFALEKFFNCKWWDYSKFVMNIRGYVSLQTSLLWGVMAFLLIQGVHPAMSKLIFPIPLTMKVYITGALLLYFLADTTKSIIDALDLREAILKYSKISVNKYKEKIIHYKRFFLAFPRLLILNASIINRDVRSILNDRIDKIKDEIKSRF